MPAKRSTTDPSATDNASTTKRAAKTPREGPTGGAVQGPASYFPSIERTYGRPVDEWLDLVRARAATGERHMDTVAWLKAEHGLGHGHANALVAHVRNEPR